jgi:hypothetical protein
LILVSERRLIPSASRRDPAFFSAFSAASAVH